MTTESEFLVGAEISLFTTMSRPALGPIQSPVQWEPGTPSLQEGITDDHSPPSSATVRNTFLIYIHRPPNNTTTLTVWKNLQPKVHT
jgi:hypothetical protein